MAGAKEKTKYVSKGERNNVNPRTMKADKIAYRDSIDCLLNKWEAWKNHKKVFLTIVNPNTNETNKKFIRVPASDVWGSSRKRENHFSFSKSEMAGTDAMAAAGF